MGRQLYSVCFFLLFGTLVISCVGTKIHVIEDPDRNRTIYRLAGLFANVSRDFVGLYGNMGIAIDMYVPVASNDTTFYIKALTLSSKQWTISCGDTLSLTIEGRKTDLLCSQPLNAGQDESITMQHTPYYFSGGWYQVNRSILHAMANASVVDIGIHTAEGLITGRLTESKLAAIREFRGKYFR